MKKRFVVLLLICIVFLGTVPTAMAADTPMCADYGLDSAGQSVAQIAIDNPDAADHYFTLNADGAPAGCTVSFIADGRSADTVTVPSGGRAEVQVHVKTDIALAVDFFRLNVTALRDDQTELFVPLSFTKNSDYAVEIMNDLNNLEVISGKNISIDIAVKNTGNKETKDLTLQADLPYKWTMVSLTPQTFSLKQDESGTFKLVVSVPPSQGAGNSEIKVSCYNNDTSSAVMTVPVKVISDVNYLWVILVIIGAVAAVTVVYFKKHGRR